MCGQLRNRRDGESDIKADDIAATLYHSLGIDPKTEYHTNTGRPVMRVPEGRVMTRSCWCRSS